MIAPENSIAPWYGESVSIRTYRRKAHRRLNGTPLATAITLTFPGVKKKKDVSASSCLLLILPTLKATHSQHKPNLKLPQRLRDLAILMSDADEEVRRGADTRRRLGRLTKEGAMNVVTDLLTSLPSGLLFTTSNPLCKHSVVQAQQQQQQR